MRPSLLHRLLRPFALVLAFAGTAQAQSLQELYEAARAYDATYLSAVALADSAAAPPGAGPRPAASHRGPGGRRRLQRLQPAGGRHPANPTGERRSVTTTNVNVNGRQPVFNRTHRRHHRPGGEAVRGLQGRARRGGAGSHHPRVAGLLRRAGRTGRAGHGKGQQDRDHRAAGLGQAQLRGRHGHDHRHPGGAGALRPFHRAGARGGERPADQAHPARPARRTSERRARGPGRAGAAADGRAVRRGAVGARRR